MEFEPREILLEKWDAALRSGNYKQSPGFLKDANGYCCLGVLCEIAGLKPEIAGTRGEQDVTDDMTPYYAFEPGDETRMLPRTLTWHMKLASGSGQFRTGDKLFSETVTVDGNDFQSLTDMNDGFALDKRCNADLTEKVTPLTFEQIADVIKNNPDKIFNKE